MNWLELKILPPLVFLSFAGLLWLAVTIFPWASFALPAKKVIALVIASLGGVVAGSSIISFLRAGTTVHPDHPEKTSKLVTTGVNAISRNPMYLSLLLVLIAWAVYLSNIASLLLTPLFVAYLNRFQIAPEERALASLFGIVYDDYCKNVRRWL